MNRLARSFLAASTFVAISALAAGCGTDENAFCFSDCAETATSAGGKSGSAGASGKGTSAGGGVTGGSGGGFVTMGGAAGTGNTGGACVASGPEVCDGVDNDCNGKVDDADLTKPASCGNCQTDCTKKVKNAAIPTCTPPSKAGDPGTCGYDKSKGCAPGFYDADKDPTNGCEYFCKPSTPGATDIACNNEDDNCDGKVDETTNLCAANSCGFCGGDCSKIPNATGKCVNAVDPAMPLPGTCNKMNVKCAIDKCAAGFVDANGKVEDGCEYKCTPSGPELCGDGIDNDCDGLVDSADPDLDPTKGPPKDPNLGKACQGGMKGVCADPANAGTTQCINNVVKCAGAKVVEPGMMPETCDGKDNDCDGSVDNNLSDLVECGNFDKGKCKKGKFVCMNGVKTCAGEVKPDAVDACNAIDDDCDDVIDGTLPDPTKPGVACADDAGCPMGQVCRPLASDPSKRVCAKIADKEGSTCGESMSPFPNPCSSGKLACENATLVCKGNVASTMPDSCGYDANCDGLLENQPDLQVDPKNCGMCGKDCSAGMMDHINWTCEAGVCKVPTDPTQKCSPGFIDCDGNPNDCEKACTFLSTQEICNGVDDNCDCSIDETKDATHPNGIAVPDPEQVCGVTPGASADPACQKKTPGNPTGVAVACVGGKFTCTFAAGHCDKGNPIGCANTPDLCDGLDNNCNGTIDDAFKPPVKTSDALGAPCKSDDGLPSPGHGECRAAGTYACAAGGLTTECAVKGKPLKCGVMPGDATYNQKACDELCDGKDNDCDGAIDESKLNSTGGQDGSNSAYFTKPGVVKIGASLWMHAYEVSRPSASATSSGAGNGYWGDTGTPGGVTIDKTPACADVPSGSNPARVPWFNVTPIEAEQTCSHMGGRVCKLSEWQTACKAAAGCTYGFASNCTSSQPTTCNLKPYDFVAGGTDDDGLFPSSAMPGGQCYANWKGQNTTGTGANPGGGANVPIYDITGNLREITLVDSTAGQPIGSRQYALMGGSFNADESGSTCDFSFYTVDPTFQLYTTGFRCCFDQYPD